ncbi:tetratricopeptide repeat protein [Pseudomonas sp.]|uniref:tetratricopeptide repeat protein n=1 Tax=Pseudomonas sp. TaxID=306 RepID=UPI0028AF7E5A|nr:tetratricopeptide repeat protein [Pseudomonas sp.]
MNRTGRSRILGCLLLLLPALATAGGNSLLIPANGRCSLNTAPEDMPEALSACQQAAQSGDSEAQFELGEYFYDGQRAPRDLKQALNWFEQASLKGHAQAQLRLGGMFFRGEGVPANNMQAFIVLKMAAVNGSEEALDTADLVAAQMRRDELDIATQVLGQIFRNYLTDLQTVDGGNSPFAPLP